MAKPTLMQRYYLGLLCLFIVISGAFTIGSLAVAASNLTNPPREGASLGFVLAAGVGFALLGCVISWGALTVLRRYRAHIESELD